MLNEIKVALEELQQENPDLFGNKVAYGKIKEDDVPDLWNYITFNRMHIKKVEHPFGIIIYIIRSI